MDLMGRLVLTLVLLLWPDSCVNLTTQTTHEYPPVLEGTSINLTCSGTTLSSERQVYWQVIKQHERVSDAALCDPKCQSYNVSKYHATYSSNAENFTSYFTVSNITTSDSGTVYKCAVFDQRMNTVKIALEVKISTVVLVPENPTCSAVSDDDLSINISCNTSRVYPDLVCELSNENSTTIMNVTKQISNSITNYSAACSYLMSETGPGLHSFRVTMFPLYKSVGHVNTSLYVETNKVNISSEPLVKLRLLNRCRQKTEPVDVTCSAYWVPSVPDITLYIGDHQFKASSESNNSFIVDYTIYRMFVSKYHINYSSSLDGKKMKCVVIYDWNGINELVDNDTTALIYPPPEPPIFRYDKGERFGENELLVKEVENVTINCEVQGGNTFVSSTELVCKNGSSSKVASANVTIVSVYLELDEMSTWQCNCRAFHVSQCYTQKVSLTVSVFHEGEWSQIKTYNTQRVFFMFIAIICSVVILVISAIVIYQRKQICVKFPCVLCTYNGKLRQWYPNHTNDKKVSGVSLSSKREYVKHKERRALRNKEAPNNKVSLGKQHLTNDYFNDLPPVPPRTYIHTPISRSISNALNIQANTVVLFYQRSTPEESSCRHHGVRNDRPELPPPRLPPKRLPYTSSSTTMNSNEKPWLYVK